MIIGKNSLVMGAVLGGMGVAFGAFGAHALKELLLTNGRPDTYELAVRYQFYHALALLAIGLLQERYPSKLFAYASSFLISGTIVFSGSLYILSLSGVTWLGAVTPIGGLLLIAGWIALAAGLITKK